MLGPEHRGTIARCMSKYPGLKGRPSPRPRGTTIALLAAAVAAVGLAYCVYLYFSQRVTEKADVTFSNPFELGPAVKFGLLYAVILVISRAAQQYLGETGLYASSIVAGLTDVDAITLSMAELSQSGGGLNLDTAARAIVLAVMSNTVVKGGIVLASGGAILRRVLLPGLALILVTGIGMAFLV